ncbi:MAG: c-type cytochrome [Myxococcota bacterium]
MPVRLTLLLCLLATAPHAQNVEDGKDVYGPCAACHGANGEGGKGGEYPRVAGQPASFTIESLKQFQQRRRHNIPMVPYTEPRELSERDMKDVAAYLETIELPSKMPPLRPDATALERLLAAERVLVVPRVKGDVDAGRALYLEQCADCHGKTGKGRASRDAPMLVGQYPEYLLRQVALFQKGARGADEGDAMFEVLKDLSAKDITDILAFLTAIQDQDEVPAADAGVSDAGATRAASDAGKADAGTATSSARE